MATRAHAVVHRSAHSSALQSFARAGLCARGVIYLLIGALTIRIALGDHGERADQTGALETVKEQPFGKALLIVLAVSLAGYVVWRLTQALIGDGRTQETFKDLARRGASLCRAVSYGYLTYQTLQVLRSHPSADKTKAHASGVLGMQGGRSILTAVGACIIVGGAVVAVRALSQKFLEHLDLSGASPRMSAAVAWIGTVGRTGRAVVVAMLGVFLVTAAVKFDPAEAKGLDETLRDLVDESYGPLLLVAAGAALLLFGVWSFLDARFRDFDR